MFEIERMDSSSIGTYRSSYSRMRWFVAAVTLLGIGLSVTLNVLHAPDRWDMQSVGAFAPIAVFLAIEMVSRVPATGRLLATGRILASLAVGAGAGYVSYLQQVDYLLRGGYESTIAHIFPGIIDGLTVVATLSLVEVTRMLRRIDVELGKRKMESAVVAPIEPTPVPTVAPVEVPVESVIEPVPAVTESGPADASVDAAKPTNRRPRRARGMGHPGTGATGAELDAAIEVTRARDAEMVSNDIVPVV